MPKNILILFCCKFFLFCIYQNVTAQAIKYCSKNVFINNPDRLQLISNIGGKHHLVSFIEKEEPAVFIFNSDLQYEGRVRLPYKFPEKGVINIIPFDDYYYLSIHERFRPDYLFLKIDGNGNFIDLSFAFQKLLASQSEHIKLGFQLIKNENQLCMTFHTAITDLNKNTLVIAYTDSLLNLTSTYKVTYDFKREEEKLHQEILMFNRYLLVLKTGAGSTSMQLMKVNLATGYAIRNTFYSSGYLYTGPGFTYNNIDSSVTVYSVLTEPRAGYKPRQYVFVSTLNKILIEQAPFVILRSHFLKNENTNFLIINDRSKWINLKAIGYSSYNSGDIRFSLLDEKLKVISDSVVQNNSDKYTMRADQFVRFTKNKKDYLLISQQFFNKDNGMVMVRSNDNGQLIFNDVRVNDRYNYLLSRAQVIPQKGVIILYTRRKEAGLVRITAE